MKKDDIKTFVVIISVCLICVVIGIVISIKSNVDKLSSVTEYNMFFSKINYINSYINYISSGNNTAVYNLLDKKYVEKNNININNVFDYVEKFSDNDYVNLTSIDYVDIGDNSSIYYIKGKIYNSGYENVKIVDDDFSIIMISDFESLSFSLYPVFDDYKDIINSIKKIKIDRNEYNELLATGTISKEQICVAYLSNFMNILFNQLSNSYDMLSDNMKKIYKTNGEYEKYINKNLSLFSTTADKCRLDEYDDERIYTVIDGNENTYIFSEQSIMNYKVDFYLKKIS